MAHSRQPVAIRHSTRCDCHACHGGELTAATPASELELEQSGRLDPTGTTTIARDLARHLRGRIGDLNADVRELLVDEDVFGLGEGDGAWEDGPREAQLAQLDEWIDERARADVLSPVEADRVREWFERAAAKGVRDGHSDLNEAGVQTDDVDTVMGQDEVQEQIDERHRALRDRVETAVTDYRQDVRRLVGSGLAANVARRVLASDITERSRVYRSHVSMQASGEVVNQYTTTQLTSYDRVDAEVQLDVDVEYVDAGDSKVCQQCLDLSGQEWTLERAQQENPIPVHDACRCRFRVVDVMQAF